MHSETLPAADEIYAMYIYAQRSASASRKLKAFVAQPRKDTDVKRHQELPPWRHEELTPGLLINLS